MSEFLTKFAEVLSSVTRSASVAKAWAELLPFVCENAGPTWTAGGLWLFDRTNSPKRLTLWHWWSTPADRLPEYISVPVEGNGSEVPLRALTNAIETGFPALRAQCRLPFPVHMHVAPISALNDPRDGSTQTLGAITLFSASASPMRPEFEKDLGSACSLIGAWMRLNREWRKSSALTTLQERQNRDHDERSLANCAAEQLVHFASARLCAAVYVPSRGRIRRLGYRGQLKNPPEPDRSSLVHAYHFGTEQTYESDELLLEFDARGQLTTPNLPGREVTLAAFPEVAAGGKPASVVLARVRDTSSTGAPHAPVSPVIATVVMATHAAPDFIGGRFSDTNRQVLQLILASFRDSYCLALQRDRMARMARDIDTLAQDRTAQVFNDKNDEADFGPFARMAVECLPSVAGAVIERTQAGIDPSEYWGPDGRLATPPDWVARYGTDRNSAVSGDDPRWASREVIDRGNGTQLHCFLLKTAPALSHVEQALLARILAEAKIAQHLHIDKDDWARQLAEVRHGMRAMVSSVLGKVELLTNRYEAAVQSRNPDEVYDRLVRRGEFRKNLRYLRHAGEELTVLFENIRALVGRLDEESLQISSFDLPKIIRSTILILETESERRDLQVNFPDSYSASERTMIGDPTWTRIALFNLIENAIKYSDRGQSINVNMAARGGLLRLSVTNHGRYIPSDMRERIFEPYQRVKPTAGTQGMPGTGLGLMMVKRFVQLHQNSEARPPTTSGRAIEVDSIPLRSSGGAVSHARTTFTIWLPRKGPRRDG